MECEWKYRGRTITAADITFIRELIDAHPQASRWELSLRLCEAWNWKQGNGVPRDMVCRGMLLMLDRAGQIKLPTARFCRQNPFSVRKAPEPLVPDNRPVQCALGAILPLEIEQVRRTGQEALFNSLIEQYHYLGYEHPVGEHVKYLVKARGQAIACLVWSSAPRHLGSRDRFIGSRAARRAAKFRARNFAANLGFNKIPSRIGVPPKRQQTRLSDVCRLGILLRSFSLRPWRRRRRRFDARQVFFAIIRA